MKDKKKIDIHLHLTAERLPERSGMKISSAGDMIPHLDELGISRGILMSGGEKRAPFCSNEECRAIAELYPERYGWMCNLDEGEEDTAAARLARCQRDGACGVGELTINHRLDHPFLQEIFRAAQELGLPVLIHMSPAEGFQYGVVDLPGLPLLEEVLRAYSRVILIGHSQPFWHEISGGAAPGRDARYAWGEGPVSPGGRLVELMERYPNLYGDLSANSGGCAVMRDPEFGLAFLERFQDRLMFGTDMVNTDMVFPLGEWLDEQYEAGRLSAAAYEKICCHNAERIFGIRAERSEDHE